MTRGIVVILALIRGGDRFGALVDGTHPTCVSHSGVSARGEPAFIAAVNLVRDSFPSITINWN